MEMVRDLLRDESQTITVEGRLVRVTRANAYLPLAEVLRSYQDAVRALDTLARERHVLLIDLRAAPSRNEPDFEAKFARIRPEIFRGFGRSAVLVRSATGSLQVRRHAREDGRDTPVFDDEAAALAYLADWNPPSSKTPRGLI